MESLRTLGWAARYPVCWLVRLDSMLRGLGIVVSVLRVASYTPCAWSGIDWIGSCWSWGIKTSSIGVCLSVCMRARARANRGAAAGSLVSIRIACGAGGRARELNWNKREEKEGML